MNQKYPAPETLSARFIMASKFLSGCIGLIGFAALVGWIYNIESLKSIVPGFMPMKVNVAVAFILTGISLFAHHYASKNHLNILWAKIPASAVFAVGFLTLLENIFNYNFHIDQLLLQQLSDINVYYPPGRMASLTAFVLSLTGAALFLEDGHQSDWLTQTTACIAGILGYFLLSGFLYHDGKSSLIAPFSWLAVHTGLNFILISGALIFMHPSRGITGILISDTDGGHSARQLLPAFITVPIILGWLKLSGEHYHLYDKESGVAIYATITAVISTVIILISTNQTMRASIRRKNAEEELQVSASTIRDLYDLAPCGYHSLSPEGIFLHINQTELSWIGYEKEEVIGKMKLPDLLTPASLPVFEWGFNTLKNSGSVSNVELSLIRKNGKIFSVLLSSTAVYDENNRFLMSRTIMLDVTENRKLKTILTDTEKRWRTALESTNQGVWDWYVSEKIMYFSHAWKAMLGYEDHEIKDRPEEFESRIHPDDREKMHQKISAHFKGETREYIAEARLRCKDGSYKWILVRGKIMTREQDGTVLRVIGTHTDITPFKENEIRLNEAKTEAERSNFELQQFAYVASHDLQEPLRMIASYLSLLELRYKDKLDSDAIEFINFAVDGAKRLQNLISNLLTFSRIETKGQTFAAVDAESVLAQVLINLKLQTEERHAKITHDPLPVIVADESQVMELFQNLISNAIKFCSERIPEIHISAEHEGDEWLFSVADNGIGIDPALQDRIFIIFKRLVGSEYPGSGIGLALCRRIVSRHGGKIWVKSEPGEGSTFYFTFPDRTSLQYTKKSAAPAKLPAVSH